MVGQAVSPNTAYLGQLPMAQSLFRWQGFRSEAKQRKRH
jgi:hypothetical protein